MKTPRRLLLLEDNLFDAGLLKRSLSSEWPDCKVEHVHAQAEFVAVLNEGCVDLILSDYFIPGFHGLKALALARERCPDVHQRP